MGKQPQRFIKSKKKNRDILSRCSECGLSYRDKAIAQRCAAWCREHKSCNLEITQHAVEVAENKIKEYE